jgi:hypothetical protein
MRYILLIYGDETADQDIAPEQWNGIMEAHRAFGAEAQERGMNPGGDALHPTPTATTVRFSSGGDTMITDGPFAETKEQLGGFYILDCKDLDEAIEMAKKLPMSDGSVEIRPVMEFD